MKPVLLFDEMYDGKDEELQKLDYEAYSVKKLRRNQKLQSDYSIIKFADNEGMILITEDTENKDACIENGIPCIQLGQNPSSEAIVEKINALGIQKHVSRKKRIATAAATLVIGGILAWLSFQYSHVILDLSFGYREFIISILGSGLGISLLFIKKALRGTAEKKLIDSMELLIFFITPASVSFSLLPSNEYTFVIILVIYFAVTLGWFGLSLLLITRGTNPEFMTRKVKYAIGSIYYLGSYLMAIGLLFVYLFMVIHPLK